MYLSSDSYRLYPSDTKGLSRKRLQQHIPTGLRAQDTSKCVAEHFILEDVLGGAEVHEVRTQ